MTGPSLTYRKILSKGYGWSLETLINLFITQTSSLGVIFDKLAMFDDVGEHGVSYSQIREFLRTDSKKYFRSRMLGIFGELFIISRVTF